MQDDFAAHAAAFSGGVPSTWEPNPPRAFDYNSVASSIPSSSASGGTGDFVNPSLVSGGIPAPTNPQSFGSTVGGGSALVSHNAMYPGGQNHAAAQQQQQQAAGHYVPSAAQQLGVHTDMVPFSENAPVGKPNAGPYATSSNPPNMINFDAERGVCTLQFTVEKAGEDGFGFSLSQFSLYEAQKNSAKTLNLAPLARKCAFARDGGLPVVDISPHGPAAKAGARQWDVIVEVDGSDIRGLTAKDSIALIKGKEKLSIHVLRRGPPPASLAMLSHGTQLYGSMVATPFVSSTPPLEKIKNDDGTMRIKYLLRKTPQNGNNLNTSTNVTTTSSSPSSSFQSTAGGGPGGGGASSSWGFTPFKYSIKEMEGLRKWYSTLRRGDWDVNALRKAVKFAKSTGGLPIQFVRQGTPAFAAGLASWDVILEVNGQDVTQETADGITQIFKAAPVETTVVILRSPNPPQAINKGPPVISYS